MLAKVWSAALDGVVAYPVRVEVDVGPGLPNFNVVGLPHGSVREGRDRVLAALRAIGRAAPPRRIIVNLAPADRRKEGSILDLPIAVGVLIGTGGLDVRSIDGTGFVGELGLDGSVQSMRGALSVTERARAEGLDRLVVPRCNAAEAMSIPGIDVVGVESLEQLVGVLEGHLQPLAPVPVEPPASTSTSDLADVRGQLQAKRAIEIAAAGGHALMLVGPPGVGKTMLARRLPFLLPDLEDEVAIDVTKVHSVAGLLDPRTGLLRRPPFRAPHHTVSYAGLIGGGNPVRPGELSLAHGGVLFLDELAEFRRHVLEALRQPLEEERVRLTRARYSVEYPARVQLVGAANPCPCGFLGDGQDRCTCDQHQVARYHSRTSGPLLDRIDLVVELGQPTTESLFEAPGTPTSTRIRTHIADVRRVQRNRNGAEGDRVRSRLNAHLTGSDVARLIHPDRNGLRMLQMARDRLSLSARGVHRVLKVARTIADLAGDPSVTEAHIAEALGFRASVRRPSRPGHLQYP